MELKVSEKEDFPLQKLRTFTDEKSYFSIHDFSAEDGEEEAYSDVALHI